MLKFYLSLLLAVSTGHLFAQIRCATEKFDSLRRQKNSTLETKDQFENWMRLKIQSSNIPGARTQEAQATYTIPVVVHIIHNNQPIGTGSNISDAQVLSQIKVLNNDFQRLNSDASQTPSQFVPFAGSMSIQFVLAKQDPLGNATTGIVRVNGGKSSWSLYEDAEIKSKSYWPGEQYMNIWVTNFPEYLGYTQFPVSNLVGLEASPKDRLTDGIIIHYRSFGSTDDGSFDLESQYNKGRTVTHEMGHFFGLRHIWGDVTSCSGTDFVADTPPQIGSTTHCPTHPAVECSGLAKMFQNYLDYTDDRCMNIFTQGQVARMDVVINNSPRRKSLLTSPGVYPPGNFGLDLGVLSVETPATLECSGAHTPAITIRNFGTTAITQANIEMRVNGSLFQTKNVSLSLNALSQTQVTFNNYTSNPADSKSYQFNILSVNGLSDEYSGNNSYSLTTQTAIQGATPFLENFESGLTNWNILNPDGLTGWTSTTLPNSTKALVIENFYYENEGAVDKIISPVFDVSTASRLILKFKLAHAQYPGVDGDALSVYMITDCSENLSAASRVFFKSGSSLGTTTPSGSYFIPSATDWKTQYVSLNSFLGNSKLRLAFVSRNGWGNNIYLDDIELIAVPVNNLTIESLTEPSMAVCTQTIIPKLQIVNNGTEIISTLNISATKNGASLPSQTISKTLNPGESTEISLSNISLSAGTNSLSITVTPNGLADGNPIDNSIAFPVAFVQNEATVPFRENFNNGNSWTILNTGNQGWTLEESNFSDFETSAVFKAYSNTNIGETSWLISPNLDLTKTIEASMFADFSYAQRGSFDDQIIITASSNCGRTIDYELYNNKASTLSNIPSTLPWNPTTKEDWTKQYFNLNSLAGLNNVLVSIQVINGNGNNLYLDNIEFFENDNASPTKVEEPFRVYVQSGTTYLTFNLDELQATRVQVASIMGSILADVTEENTLNQTLTFGLGVNPGIYIFKIQIGAKTYAIRQYMDH